MQCANVRVKDKKNKGHAMCGANVPKWSRGRRDTLEALLSALLNFSRFGAAECRRFAVQSVKL